MRFLPNITLFVGENPQEELSVQVWYVGLRYYDILAGGQGEKRHHLPRYRVIRYVQRFLKKKSFVSLRTITHRVEVLIKLMLSNAVFYRLTLLALRGINEGKNTPEAGENGTYSTFKELSSHMLPSLFKSSYI